MPDAGLSISQTADLLGFTKNGPKKRKYPVSSSWRKEHESMDHPALSQRFRLVVGV